jgi:hypothetical protein
MSRKAVRSGQTDPSAVINLLNRGVDIHSVENLHAKVFVLGNHAIVGSTNPSQHSANDLIEAAIETTDETTVVACRDFVLNLAGEYITLQHAREMKPLYKPPSPGKGKGATPKHAPLWVVSLVRGDWDSEDNAADKTGIPRAKEGLYSSRLYRVDKFKWVGEPLIGKLQKMDQLLQIIKIGKTRYVYPAGRIIHVEKYKVGNSSRAIVYLEVPKKLKRKKLTLVVESLGEAAKVLKRIKYFRLLKNAALVHDLLKRWPRGITLRTISLS